MSSIDASTLLGAGADGYQIERSLRFNAPDSAFLSRAFTSDGGSTWTISCWLKRSEVDTRDFSFTLMHAGSYPNPYEMVQIGSNQIIYYNDGGASAQGGRTTSAVFRDCSAWYHIVCVRQGTSQFKIYVNGVEQAAASNTNPSASYALNKAATMYIGQNNNYDGGGIKYSAGYLTEYHFVSGQALTPSSFGETDTITGVWKPKRYSGTYGTNGFYLKFADNSGTTSTTLGKDSSGNGNNWTPNNFSVTAGAGNDSLIDTPTPYADGGNGRGNYPTWNPLDRTAATYSNGNLDVTSTSAASPYNMTSTMRFPATGKWYAEVTLTGLGAGSPGIGIGKNNSDAYAIYRITGAYLTSGMGASTSGTPNTYTTNDVIGIAYDAGAGTLEFYKNGVDQAGNITGITASTEWAIVFRADSASGDAATLNAGQRPFAYTPPSGFLALNTQNLPEPSIKKGNMYFDATTYTGTGTTQSITNSGSMQPDFVWVKSRSNAYQHWLFDSVRGAGLYLNSNATTAEGNGGSAVLSSFNANGFTYGSDVSGNGSGSTYVAWQWKESATPGFDIVTYTGDGVSNRTVSHALGVAPAMIIIKDRDTNSNANNWFVWHQSLSSGNNIQLEKTDPAYAVSSTGGGGIGTSPSSSTFTLLNGSSSNVNTNENGDRFVAYLWSEVAGFSKFGSYTGNGSTDGTFVYCGFRPRWIMVKWTGGVENWAIIDTVRSPSNTVPTQLFANLSGAENTDANQAVDILSNGFKPRGSLDLFNASGNTYIFAAFAESPFKYSLAR